METLVLFLIAIAGAGIHILLKWRDAVTKKIEFDWKPQLIGSAVSLIIAFILIGIRERIRVFIDINEFGALFLGYSADSVFKNLEAKWNNKVKAITGD